MTIGLLCMCICLGPRSRCKVISEAEPQAERGLQSGENTTGKCSGEPSPRVDQTTARNENMQRSLLNHGNFPKDNAYGQHREVMTGGVIRKPKDPFDFHLYIGFSPENNAVIQRVIHKLKITLNDLLCHFRGNGQIADMKNAIECSEKCLLCITPEYMKDPLFEAEVKAAVKKARRFSKDMLFVLKDPRVDAGSLNDLDLHEFQTADWSIAVGKLSSQLVLWLRQDAELAIMPKEPDKLSGYFEAFTYHYGFLNLLLQDYRQKVKSVVESSPEAFASSGAKVVLPMLIVIPESHRSVSFDVEDKIITCPDYIVTASHHSGSMKRDYKQSVRKLVVDADKNNVIYFTADFPAILSTVSETYTTGQTGLTENQLDEIKIDFFRILQSLLCHPDNRHCIDQYRLVWWPDNHVGLYDFLLPIVRGAAQEEEASSLVVDASSSRGIQLLNSSFSRLESKNTGLRKLSGASEPYMMRDVSRRGICLIIVVSDVTPTSHRDVQQLHTLFSEQFDFDVRVHVDKMTWDRLDTLLCEVAQEDHSRYDAFVCYLESRGQLGSVCTSDEISKPVNTLVNNFVINNHEDLHRKPKIFLIQTADDGTADISTSNNNERQVGLLYCTL